jgi:hypothetical protein
VDVSRGSHSVRGGLSQRCAIDQAWTADPDSIDDPPWVDLIEAELVDGNR